MAFGSLSILNRIATELAWWKQGRVPIISRWGRELLRRPFPAGSCCRVLLIYQDDKLAYPQFAPFLREAHRFEALGIHFRAVPYHDYDPDLLPPELDAIFLQSTYGPLAGELEQLLGGMKAAHPRINIAYFDWFAPTDLRFAERVDKWANHYVKKSLLRDRTAYLRSAVGHSNLSDYFSARLRTDNPPIEWKVPESVISKLIVGPSFSTSPELVNYFEKEHLPSEGPRPIDLHARFETRGTPWYTAMRTEAARVVIRAFPDLKVANEGMVAKSLYMNELQRSKLCFSPFGYGEVCWRDFEAVAVGSVLVKPDMGHLETNPDIYRPFETYIPVRWDLADLNDRVRAALADRPAMRRMAVSAFEVVRDHLRGAALLDLAMRCADNRAAEPLASPTLPENRDVRLRGSLGTTAHRGGA